MTFAVVLSALLLATGCSATWDGMRRDTDSLFSSDATEDKVLQAQRLLNERGYDTGTPDGLVGPRTTRAILAYQADHGLHRTGYVDDELVASLRGKAPPKRSQTKAAKNDEDWVDPY